jgi:hypothetical protein
MKGYDERVRSIEETYEKSVLAEDGNSIHTEDTGLEKSSEPEQTKDSHLL